jgi:hypothetical protein
MAALGGFGRNGERGALYEALISMDDSYATRAAALRPQEARAIRNHNSKLETHAPWKLIQKVRTLPPQTLQPLVRRLVTYSVETSPDEGTEKCKRSYG